MKVQLFSIAALATLSISPAAFAETVSNTEITSIKQDQKNIILGGSGTQDGPQTAESAKQDAGSLTGTAINDPAPVVKPPVKVHHEYMYDPKKPSGDHCKTGYCY